MIDETSRVIEQCGVDEMADWLAGQQLDLLAQVDAQLRAVHRVLRRIEKVRAARHAEGPLPPSEDRRGKGVKALSGEIAELDVHLASQADCCREMMATIEGMQSRIADVKLGVPLGAGEPE
jgi:uncharacterized coiled-coil protein SlyX